MKKIYLFICLLSLFYLIPQVQAVGIALNGPQTRYFEPNAQLIFSFDVINSEGRDMYVDVGISGDLAKYSILNISRVYVGAGSSETVAVVVNLPDRLEKPGDNRLLLNALEALPEGATVSARAGVRMSYRVFMPYPGKYIETTLAAENVKENDPFQLKLTVHNLGQDTLEELYTTFSILNNNNKTLTSAKSNSISINSKEDTSLMAWVDPNTLLPAEYTLKAKTYFDGETREDKTKFKVGTLQIDILNFTKTLPSESVKHFLIFIESNWNDPINDIYAVITLSNLTGQELKKVRTPNYDVNSFEKKILDPFFETSGVSPGEYIVDITIHYDQKTTSNKAAFVITERDKEQKPLNISFNNINSTTIIILLLVAVIVLLVVLDIIVLRKKGDKK